MYRSEGSVPMATVVLRDNARVTSHSQPQGSCSTPRVDKYIFNLMVKYSEEVAHVCGALSEPTRYDILARLARRNELSASDIAQAYAVSQPAISKHLRVLTHANLIKVSRQGRNRLYTLNRKTLRDFRQWIEQSDLFWQQNIDNLAHYIDNTYQH